MTKVLQSELMAFMVQAMAQGARSPLDSVRGLELACEKNWRLTTEELAQLLGIAPNTIRAYGAGFSKRGFKFVRKGHPRDYVWELSKQ